MYHSVANPPRIPGSLTDCIACFWNSRLPGRSQNLTEFHKILKNIISVDFYSYFLAVFSVRTAEVIAAVYTADCERVFSMMRHIKKNFAISWGEREEALLAVGRNSLQNMGQCCYEVKVGRDLINSAKAATTKALEEYQKGRGNCMN